MLVPVPVGCTGNIFTCLLLCFLCFQDVQWNDIDYMLNFNDFTIDPVTFGNLTQLVQDIHDAGMHYVPILDPGVSAAEPSGTYPPYDEGIAKDIFVKNSDGSVFIGRVWNPVSTAYPDFTHPNATNYWASLLQDFYEKVKFDGIWIVSLYDFLFEIQLY